MSGKNKGQNQGHSFAKFWKNKGQGSYKKCTELTKKVWPRLREHALLQGDPSAGEPGLGWVDFDLGCSMAGGLLL